MEQQQPHTKEMTYNSINNNNNTQQQVHHTTHLLPSSISSTRELMVFPARYIAIRLCIEDSFLLIVIAFFMSSLSNSIPARLIRREYAYINGILG